MNCSVARGLVGLVGDGRLPLGRRFVARAVLSESETGKVRYPAVGAKSAGTLPAKHLLEVVEAAAKAGAEVSCC